MHLRDAVHLEEYATGAKKREIFFILRRLKIAEAEKKKNSFSETEKRGSILGSFFRVYWVSLHWEARNIKLIHSIITVHMCT